MFKRLKLFSLVGLLAGCDHHPVDDRGDYEDLFICKISEGGTEISDGGPVEPNCFGFLKNNKIEFKNYDQIKKNLGEPCLEEQDEYGVYIELYYCAIKNSELNNCATDFCLQRCEDFYRIALLSKNRVVSCKILKNTDP